MSNTIKRISYQESLARLGIILRERRISLGLSQAQVRGMRQPTVSKIERGGAANLDTVINYATALGLELALVPIGRVNTVLGVDGGSYPAIVPASRDLLDEFSDLQDETL